jgi:anaerobic selenocysteine-containing dehydrogenase
MATASNGKTIWFKGACPHDCPDTCATLVEVDPSAGRAVSFAGDPSHPITDGWLCAKVRPYLERVYAPDRVLYPMRRVGPKGSGDFERISWDAALNEISSRWKAIIAEFGAEAILPYTYSGTLGTVELNVAGSRFWGRLGSSMSVGDLCSGATRAAVTATIGGNYGPDPRDVLHSKLILIWAHNPASTNPHFVPFMREAQRNGARVVVIDPRRSKTARSADQHIVITPGTDTALALGMMDVIFSEGLHAEEWLEQHSIGWRELRDRAAEYPLDRVSTITGIDADTIQSLACEYATTKPALLKVAQAINRHVHGGQTVRAIACLAGVAGQMGIRGGGLFTSTSSQIQFDYNVVTKSDQYPPFPREINMIQLGANLTGQIDNPPIKSLFVYACNPVAASPNSTQTIEGLLRDDLFTIVHEQFMTDTAQYADIVLPAVTQLERVDLHIPYGHLFLQYNQQALAPIGESVSNWDLMRRLATAMGFSEPWLQQTADQVIDEIMTATASINPRFEGVTLERLQREGTVTIFEDGYVPFADGVFPTPSGKMELTSQAFADAGLDPLPQWTPVAEYQSDRPGGLIVISAAPHHSITTSMSHQPSLMRKEGDPHLEINPDDAAERGIEHGMWIWVENERGNCLLRAVITSDVPCGVTICPKGRWAKLSPGGRTLNWLISDKVSDIGMQATFHSTMLWARPATPEEMGAPVAEPEMALAGD